MGNPYEAPQSDVENGAADEYGEIKVFSFKGRMGRIRYVGYGVGLAILVQFIVSFFVGIFFAWYGPDQPWLSASIVPTLTAVPVILISIMLTAQRLHDLNQAGWYSLLMLIPGVNILFGLILTFLPGTDKENRFGLKPPPNTVGTYIVALVVPFMIIGILAAIAIPAYNDFVKRTEMESISQP